MRKLPGHPPPADPSRWVNIKLKAAQDEVAKSQGEVAKLLADVVTMRAQVVAWRAQSAVDIQILREEVQGRPAPVESKP